MILLILGLLAYLLGSVPSAVWLGKWIFEVDIRDYGSGNAGATNTFRVFGKRAGFLVLMLDIAKAILAIELSRYILSDPSSTQLIILGLLTTVGHIFPLFAQFRGGKGIATLLGVLIAVQPIMALLAITLFLLVWILSNYISLASMFSALSLMMWYQILGIHDIGVYIFSILVGCLVVFSHRENIKRLLRREENKMYLIKSKR